jgi:DMSO reductase anchor subunit
MVGIFGGRGVVTLAGRMKNTVSKWLITATAIAGALALLAMSMTYAPPSMPAIDNYLPLVFFGLTTLILGAAIASYFVPEEQQHWLTIVLAISLTTALVVTLLVPTIWISGDKVMQMTGQLHLASPLYWIHLGVGLALPLAVLAWARRIPVWLPPLLFIGEFSGRIIFFSLVLSSAVNLGGLY